MGRVGRRFGLKEKKTNERDDVAKRYSIARVIYCKVLIKVNNFPRRFRATKERGRKDENFVPKLLPIFQGTKQRPIRV